MLNDLLWAVPVAMTATTLWRLPSLWHGDPLQRALWMCCAGFAAALWCRVPQVKFALDHSPVTDLSALLKYVASLAAILAGLKYIVGVYEGPPSKAGQSKHVAVSRWVSRIAHGFAFAWLVLLVVLFFTAVDRTEPSADFAADHAGQWGAGLFLTIAYVYLGAAAGTACFQWARASRRADHRSLRVGLTLMSAATLIYTVYPAMRIITVWAPTGASVVTMRTIADSVTLTVALLWATGAAIPSTAVLFERWATWRTLRKLHPLWSDLLQQFPHLAFQPAGSRITEVVRLWLPLNMRLDRRTQEIADAVEQLRHYATPDLLPCAQYLAENHEDPEPAAEAYWIKSALTSAEAGRRSPAPAGMLPKKPLTSSHAEAYWLASVVDVYVRITPEIVRILHERAGRPDVVESEPELCPTTGRTVPTGV
ncbi:MAB_1171c family putative transporter [Streptomyces sp. NPDC048211]|uniref:MAB_1171c family putative transporter n=1 Tax=Streptomyces sp. NPDC048211 TaxID=3365516 RepID=UPI00372303E1